ncbi:cytotoxic T-lymphocyte protein 4-like [Pseudochaenichthys georgianus]|uniref:cytotoxic T-lymphocyte protein 4-like n=1 Tax=Pseudochaenichthys georgianus TaxID=52239 RepID=UPI0039C4CB4C
MALFVWTVLSLCLPAWSAVRVVQPYKVVSSNGTALVQCFLHPQPFHRQSPLPNNDLSYPFPEPEDLRVTLLRGLHGSTKICSSILNLTGPIETGEEGEVQCSAQRREGALELTVSGLRATDTDLYRCDIEIFYPPPYLRFTGNGTLIHILGSSDSPAPGAQRQISNKEDEGEEDEDEETAAPVSVPVIVLVVLVLFVLIVIMYLQASQCDRGRREMIRPVHTVDAAVFSCYNLA